VGLGNLTDDREPETRARHSARRSRSVEAVEDVGKVLLVDTRPMVAHGHLAVAYRDLDLPACRAPLRGVVEQVPNGPVDRSRIAVDD
jgi:hypothetical protein